MKLRNARIKLCLNIGVHVELLQLELKDDSIRQKVANSYRMFLKGIEKKEVSDLTY